MQNQTKKKKKKVGQGFNNAIRINLNGIGCLEIQPHWVFQVKQLRNQKQ